MGPKNSRGQCALEMLFMIMVMTTFILGIRAISQENAYLFRHAQLSRSFKR